MANPLADAGGQIFGRIFSSVFWIGLSVILIIAVGSTMYWFFVYKRSFNIDVTIRSKRSNGEYRTLFDKAAILKDRKTGEPFLRIWELKAELPMPSFGVIEKSGRKDHVYIYRNSETDIGYLAPPTVSNIKTIRQDGKIHHTLGLQESIPHDLDDAYWRAIRNEQNKRMFDKEKWFWKALEFAPQIIGGVILLFILWIFMDKLPSILGDLQNLVKEMRTLKSAEVVTGMIPLALMRLKHGRT